MIVTKSLPGFYKETVVLGGPRRLQGGSLASSLPRILKNPRRIRKESLESLTESVENP